MEPGVSLGRLTRMEALVCVPVRFVARFHSYAPSDRLTQYRKFVRTILRRSVNWS